MVLLVLMTIVLIGVLCVAAYTLAIYALPFMLGLAAARFAYETGAGLLGAGIVALVVGAAAWGVLLLLFTTLRAPILRLIVALVFAAPAAVAGYFLVHGIAREAVPSEIWRQIFCVAGGLLIGPAAFGRLVVPVPLKPTSAGAMTAPSSN
jgi:hypothetical protein